jgi:hypothetical protein
MSKASAAVLPLLQRRCATAEHSVNSTAYTSYTSSYPSQHSLGDQTTPSMAHSQGGLSSINSFSSTSQPSFSSDITPNSNGNSFGSAGGASFGVPATASSSPASSISTTSLSSTQPRSTSIRTTSFVTQPRTAPVIATPQQTLSNCWDWDFENLSWIGNGAYGRVYRATWKAFNKVVALKEFTSNTEISNDAIHEISTLRYMTHPVATASISTQNDVLTDWLTHDNSLADRSCDAIV